MPWRINQHLLAAPPEHTLNAAYLKEVFCSIKLLAEQGNVLPNRVSKYTCLFQLHQVNWICQSLCCGEQRACQLAAKSKPQSGSSYGNQF